MSYVASIIIFKFKQDRDSKGFQNSIQIHTGKCVKEINQLRTNLYPYTDSAVFLIVNNVKAGAYGVRKSKHRISRSVAQLGCICKASVADCSNEY